MSVQIVHSIKSCVHDLKVQVPVLNSGIDPGQVQGSYAHEASADMALPCAVSVFGEVAALRTVHQVPRKPQPQVLLRQPILTLRLLPLTMDMGTVCTICLEEFRPRDHVCRLECGHTFHCICVGEAAMHASIMSDVGLSLECPNCLRVTQARSSWHYPDLPQQQPSQPLGEPAMPAHSGTTGGADSEDFRAPPEHPPSEHAFPWWPVESHLQTSSGSNDPSSSAAVAYHSRVRLSDGRPGLLVDPGSFGNLVGEQWLAEAAAAVRQEPTMQRRAQPLQVGGVGKGLQVCLDNCPAAANDPK